MNDYLLDLRLENPSEPVTFFGNYEVKLLIFKSCLRRT